jgi:hypothetical protein
MNETDAKKLTERIVGTWPASPKGFVWTEELLTLDAAIARAAIAQLTHEHDEARLPVSRFLAVYRAIRDQGNTGRRHPHDHDTDGPPMSFDEYIALLTAKAHAGDTDAGELLDVWAENLARTPKGNHL